MAAWSPASSAKLDAVDLLDGLIPAIVLLPAARAMIEADPPSTRGRSMRRRIRTKAGIPRHQHQGVDPENGMLTPTLKARRASIENISRRASRPGATAIRRLSGRHGPDADGRDGDAGRSGRAILAGLA